MYHLRVPVFLLAVLVLLRCIAAAPNHRFFGPDFPNNEQENALQDKESRSLPELISDPFPGLRGARPQRQVLARRSPPVKRTCKTTYCLKNWLQDIMSRLGKGEIKSVDLIVHSVAKRDIHQPPAQLPF